MIRTSALGAWVGKPVRGIVGPGRGEHERHDECRAHQQEQQVL